MGSFIGGLRFKVEQVDNGWYIEFHPRKNDGLNSVTLIQKHCAGPDVADLIEVLHELLYREQVRLAREEEPTASQPEPE